jgi:thiamine pyrophosphokinase
MPRIIIFANGDVPDSRRVAALIKPDDLVVCADGGSRHAFALGLNPHMVIGDLDSIHWKDWAKVQSDAVPVRRHPHDKNETDLELALRYALEQDPSSIVIVGALGKRVDHTLGNLALLSSPALASIDVRFDDGLEEAFFCRSRSSLEGRVGDIVSLIPWSAPVEGVTTTGLRWPLRAETLYPEKSRGISNEMLEATVSITITSGLLLVLHRRQSQAEIEKFEAGISS